MKSAPVLDSRGSKRNSIALLRMHQTLIFGQDVAKSKDERRVSRFECHALMPIEGLFLELSSIQAQVIVKGIRRNETATILRL